MKNASPDYNYITDGPITGALLRFALPYMLVMLLQVLYGAVDMFVIGLYCQAETSSAVAIGAQIMHALTVVLIGLSFGSIVLIGFRVGEKNDAGIAEAVGNTAALFTLLAIVLTPLTVLFSDEIVRWMRTPEPVVPLAKSYIFTCSCGIPFIVGYNVVSAIFRGFGDSKTPVLFVSVACVVNLAADFLLIGTFHMGAFGAALATIFSQALSFFFALGYMRVKRFAFEFHRTHFWPKLSVCWRIIRVGFPLALQDTVISVSFVLILAIVNMMGVTASAGLGVAQRVIGFIFIIPVSFASAVATITAQNLGARQPKRALESLWKGIAFSLTLTLVFFLYCQIAPESLSGFFTRDPAVRRAAGLYMKSFTIDCLMVSFVFSMNSYFIGCGKTVISLVHSVIATACVRIPLSYALSLIPGATLYTVGFAAPAATLLSIIICIAYFFWLKKTGTSLAPPNPSADVRSAA